MRGRWDPRERIRQVDRELGRWKEGLTKSMPPDGTVWLN